MSNNMQPNLFDEATISTTLPRPGLHLGASLQYFMELEDVNEMLRSFAMTKEGILGLIEKTKYLNGVTEKIEIKESIKKLTSFTLDQIKKISRKLKLAPQKTKKEYVDNLTMVVTKHAPKALCDQQSRDFARLRNQYANSLIIMRFVGVVFHSDFSAAYANLNDSKKRLDFESGSGANNERFFENVAAIVNDNNSSYHSSFLLLESNDRNVELYIKRLDETHLHEHPSYKLDETVTWQKLKSLNFFLVKAFNIVKQNMTVSGNHDHDIYNYTAVAISKCKASTNLSKVGLYYFCCHMSFNEQLCFANCATIPESMQASTLDVDKLVSSFKTPNLPVKKVKKEAEDMSEQQTAMGNSTTSGAVDFLKSILSSIATRIDKRVEIDMVSSWMDRSDKLSDRINELFKLQVSMYGVLSTTISPDRKVSIEANIDRIEAEIKMNQEELDQMRLQKNEQKNEQMSEHVVNNIITPKSSVLLVDNETDDDESLDNITTDMYESPDNITTDMYESPDLLAPDLSLLSDVASDVVRI